MARNLPGTRRQGYTFFAIFAGANMFLVSKLTSAAEFFTLQPSVPA